jgi:hypothetical protein
MIALEEELNIQFMVVLVFLEPMETIATLHLQILAKKTLLQNYKLHTSQKWICCIKERFPFLLPFPPSICNNRSDWYKISLALFLLF